MPANTMTLAVEAHRITRSAKESSALATAISPLPRRPELRCLVAPRPGVGRYMGIWCVSGLGHKPSAYTVRVEASLSPHRLLCGVVGQTLRGCLTLLTRASSSGKRHR